MVQRKSHNPKRRLAPPELVDSAARANLADRLKYSGSAHHKRNPGDYGFHPPTNPRPWKSLCDGRQTILKEEAQALLRLGASQALFSEFSDTELPKYVWAVDSDGEVYEAKLDRNGYHGYRLEEEDDFRSVILKEQARRCKLR